MGTSRCIIIIMLLSFGKYTHYLVRQDAIDSTTETAPGTHEITTEADPPPAGINYSSYSSVRRRAGPSGEKKTNGVGEALVVAAYHPGTLRHPDAGTHEGVPGGFQILPAH